MWSEAGQLLLCGPYLGQSGTMREKHYPLIGRYTEIMLAAASLHDSDHRHTSVRRNTPRCRATRPSSGDFYIPGDILSFDYIVSKYMIRIIERTAMWIVPETGIYPFE